MAKGAKKKTKWVSLSLASATTTDVPTAEQNAASKSNRWNNQIARDDENAVNADKLSYSQNDISNASSVERKSSWNSSQNYSNGNRSHPSRNYSDHFKSHYSRSYYHNDSRRSHHSGYNDRNRFNNVNETKSEQNGTVIINEEEYTKITTPRQDVLFKKGYLSRPRKHTMTSTNASETEFAMGGSSTNDATDGSDVATGSGTVSTAESITSDSTYLTDGHLLDYPAPLPYFGYIDQSGVIVMNGFAVDNSGYSYMNGGQTYIYPPNYHCQSSFDEDGQVELTDAAEPIASDGDQHQPADDSVSEIENAANVLDARLNSISEETVDGLVNENDSAEFNQQVPQQAMLSSFENCYDYAQYYNPFFYPGCVVAPFPMVGNEMYCDQFDGVSEEEQARQQSFRKRKKRYRNWDEYPSNFYPDGTFDTMYQYPNFSCIPEKEISNPTEVPVDAIIPELNDRTVPTLPPINETVDNNLNTIESTRSELPTSRAEQCTSPTRQPKLTNVQKADDQSHPSIVSSKSRSHTQKTRKKDLIELTRAFAEQNIDLTRPASLYPTAEVQRRESSEWRTVRNGKEITIDDDRERSSVRAKNDAKKNNDASEPVLKDKLFFDDCKPDQMVQMESSGSIKQGRKETNAKKGKKTAKGKGKKQKKSGALHQQTGFVVIEPEFPVVRERSVDKKDFPPSTDVEEEEVLISDNEDPELNKEQHDVDNVISDNEDPEELNKEHDVDNVVEHVEVQIQILHEEESVSAVLISNEVVEDDDDECLEGDLLDIQLSDLLIETCDREGINCEAEKETEDDVSSKVNEIENINISEELTVQNPTDDIEENVDNEQLEVPSHSEELREIENVATISNETYAKEDESIEIEVEANCSLPIYHTELSPTNEMDKYELDVSEEEQKCKHFSNEEYSEDFDSGVQSPAAFTTSSCNSKERKWSSSSVGSQDIHLTDAVTKWLSETLSNKRLEEMFVLPEDPLLLHRIHQFNMLSFDDSLVLSSDTYSSSSGDEVDEYVDSDYMSDAQTKNRRDLNGYLAGQQKTEIKKDQLLKQTANGHRHNGGDHSNHKQKRCIIM